MDKTFLKMLEDRIMAIEAQEKAYEELANAEEPDFQSAVEIAARRIGQAKKIDSKNRAKELLAGIFAQDKLLPETISIEALNELVEKSRNDHQAFRALRFFVETVPDELHPPSVAEWRRLHRLGCSEIPPLPRGMPAYRNVHRNGLIVGEINRLKRAGFRATRNKSGDARSACDVIAAALEANGHALSYDAVESIWQKRHEFQESQTLIGMRDALIEKICTEH